MENLSKNFTSVLIALKDIPYDEKKSIIKVILKSSEVDLVNDDHSTLFSKL